MRRDVEDEQAEVRVQRANVKPIAGTIRTFRDDGTELLTTDCTDCTDTGLSIERGGADVPLTAVAAWSPRPTAARKKKAGRAGRVQPMKMLNGRVS
jgi:hypothetical protein